MRHILILSVVLSGLLISCNGQDFQILPTTTSSLSQYATASLQRYQSTWPTEPSLKYRANRYHFSTGYEVHIKDPIHYILKTFHDPLNEKIIISGINGVSYNFYIRQYDREGNYDPSFDAELQSINKDYRVLDIARTAAGDYFVLAFLKNVQPVFSKINSNLILFRLLSDGKLDKTFGNNEGKISFKSIPLSINNHFPFQITQAFLIIQDNGNVVLYNENCNLSTDQKLNISSYEITPTGQVSNTLTSFCDYSPTERYGTTLLKNGYFIRHSNKSSTKFDQITLQRFDTSGTLDLSFGTQGKVFIDYQKDLAGMIDPKEHTFFFTEVVANKNGDTYLIIQNKTFDNTIMQNSAKYFVVKLSFDGIIDQNYLNNQKQVTTVLEEGQFSSTVSEDGRVYILQVSKNKIHLIGIQNDGKYDPDFKRETEDGLKTLYRSFNVGMHSKLYLKEGKLLWEYAHIKNPWDKEFTKVFWFLEP